MPSIASSASKLSDALIARVCRGTPAEAQALALELSASDRARLALFCNSRAHLRAHGREIARVCTEASLIQEGGLAGGMLLRQLNTGPDSWGDGPRLSAKKVSLSGPRSFAASDCGPLIERSSQGM